MPVVISLTSGYSLTHPSGGPASGVHRRGEECGEKHLLQPDRNLEVFVNYLELLW